MGHARYDISRPRFHKGRLGCGVRPYAHIGNALMGQRKRLFSRARAHAPREPAIIVRMSNRLVDMGAAARCGNASSPQRLKRAVMHGFRQPYILMHATKQTLFWPNEPFCTRCADGMIEACPRKAEANEIGVTVTEAAVTPSALLDLTTFSYCSSEFRPMTVPLLLPWSVVVRSKIALGCSTV